MKIDEILIIINKDKWTTRNVPEKLDEAKQALKQLILERIERKSVEELKDKIPEAMTDLASRICFKEGYNKSVDDVTKVINDLFDGRE